MSTGSKYNRTWQVGQASKRYLNALPADVKLAIVTDTEQANRIREAFEAGARWGTKSGKG